MVFLDSKHPERPDGLELRGLRYIALTIESLDDYKDIIQDYPIQTDWNQRRYVIIKDPDGQPVQLIESKCEE